MCLTALKVFNRLAYGHFSPYGDSSLVYLNKISYISCSFLSIILDHVMNGFENLVNQNFLVEQEFSKKYSLATMHGFSLLDDTLG